MYQESGEGGLRDDRKLLKQVWTDQERGEGLYQSLREQSMMFDMVIHCLGW